MEGGTVEIEVDVMDTNTDTKDTLPGKPEEDSPEMRKPEEDSAEMRKPEEDSPEMSAVLLFSPENEVITQVQADAGSSPDGQAPDGGTLEHTPVNPAVENMVHQLPSQLDVGNESEQTDDEFLDVEVSDEELDMADNLISIFEYNEAGLTKTSHLSLGDSDFARDSLDGDTEEFKCSSCDKVCSTWASFQHHLRSHSRADSLTCPLCQKTFQAKSLMERHIRSFHNKEKLYICRFCGRGFSTEWYCQKHEGHHENGTGPRITARDKKNICQFCRKEFPKLKQLQMHEATHTGEKSFSCSHCYKTFCYSSSLLKHLKSSHSDKPALCVYCDKVFSTMESLLKHQEHHIGMNQYRCRRCEVIFNDMLSLKRHGRAVHYDEIDRPHVCEHCDKRFAQKSMLEAHLRCHTGEKPFLCPHCGKTFRQKSQLKTHLRCHSLERSHSCGTCGKNFTSSSMLQHHEETNACDESHTCHTCQKSFPSSPSLRQHARTHKVQSHSRVGRTDDDSSMSQDAEILALALKSFVQSMAQAQKDQNGEEPRPSHTGDNPEQQASTVLNEPQQSSLDTSNAFSKTSAVAIDQNLTTTKIETARGPVEILSFAIEEGIRPATEESEKEGEACDVIEEAPKPREVESVLEGSQPVDNELNIDEMQVSDDVTPHLEEAGDLDADMPGGYIALSILANPNMEKIKQKYSRKPQMVQSLLGTCDANDMEMQNALIKLGVSCEEAALAGSTEVSQQVPSAGQGPHQTVDPAEESEATDGEFDDDLDVEKLDHVQEGSSKDKVFESLSIFEFTNNGLVCIRKIDMFEPKFHRKCARCGKSFFSQGGYEGHMKRHDSQPEFPYMCQYCGRGFASKVSLKAHEAIHTGETLYKCKFCPREFRNYSSHRIHTATHSRLKPYFCRFCNKPFAQVAHVQRHERTHTGSRPYACEFCDKAFAEWGTWQRHTRIHTGERPYVCPTCGKGFIVKFSLRRHMKTHEKDGSMGTGQSHQLTDTNGSDGGIISGQADGMNDSVTLMIDGVGNLVKDNKHIIFDQKQGGGDSVLNEAEQIKEIMENAEVTVLIDR